MSNHTQEAERQAARLRRKTNAGGKVAGRKLAASFKSSSATRNKGSWTKAGKTPATIVKVNKGGLAGDQYMCKKKGEKGAQAILTNMFSDGLDHQGRKEEWAIDQARHPRVKHLFTHVSISRPEGLPLSDEQWSEYIKRWLHEIGAEGVNFNAVRHNDTKQDHVHLIFSRALPNGKLLSDSNSYYRFRAAARVAEKAIGLETLGVSERPASHSQAEVAATRMAQRQGKPAGRIDAKLIEAAAASSTSFEQFSTQLATRGVQVDVSKRASGQVRGLLFKQKGAASWLAGTSIDREFSYQKLQKRIEENQKKQHAQQHILNARRLAERARNQNTKEGFKKWKITSNSQKRT